MSSKQLITIPVEDSSTVVRALQRLLETRALGRYDSPKVAHLCRLLNRQPPRVPLSTVLQTIWPDRSETQALNLYRGFKMRLNQRLEQANIPLTLVSEKDNRKVADKTLSFDQTISLAGST
jgi:hypothetical protein